LAKVYLYLLNTEPLKKILILEDNNRWIELSIGFSRLSSLICPLQFGNHVRQRQTNSKK
jgi:hypothetical protein